MDMLAGGDEKKREELELRFPDLYDLSKLDESWAICLQWSMERTKQELMEEAQKYRVPCMKVSTPEDLVEDKHFKAVNFFIELEHPVAGKFFYPGVPVKLKGCPAQVTRPAPLLGQHNELVMRDILGMTDDEITEVLAAGAIA